uniref:Uncharacterized protein n=1 Tax=Chelonoidis abingdonii TaxID=106734 RepID=A0A8C0GNU7_CHEAB
MSSAAKTGARTAGKGSLLGLQPRFYQDSDSLRRLIRKELEGLRVKLYPYVDEVQQKISKNLEVLRFQMIPFTQELLDQVMLKARELQQHLTPTRDMKAQFLEGIDEVQRFVSQYANKIAFHTDQVKEIFHPYAARLKSEGRHGVWLTAPQNGPARVWFAVRQSLFRPCSCHRITLFTGAKITLTAQSGVQDLWLPQGPRGEARCGKRTEGQRMLNAPRRDPGGEDV